MGQIIMIHCRITLDNLSDIAIDKEFPRRQAVAERPRGGRRCGFGGNHSGAGSRCFGVFCCAVAGKGGISDIMAST